MRHEPEFHFFILDDGGSGLFCLHGLLFLASAAMLRMSSKSQYNPTGKFLTGAHLRRARIPVTPTPAAHARHPLMNSTPRPPAPPRVVGRGRRGNSTWPLAGTIERK
ncbi:hypothetical protein DFH07DRAFT_968759 [Mycena maculata]|uniref:Uncharacterized protein n=1 Tax=Mycena maculata TaxID=230809 RepID=A0AAD7HYU7_9AGAR|nr:hypothetical protein DFH07DRAFT_968759 [Mycena maculata]